MGRQSRAKAAARAARGSTGPIPGNPSLPNSPPGVPPLGNFGSSGAVRLRDIGGRFVKGGWGFEFQNLGGVLDTPNTVARQLDENVSSSMEQLAKEMEKYAKENAPWEDQSGDARSGLRAAVAFNKAAGQYSVYLGYNVSYGVYLENSNGGVYAIVGPTIRRFQPELANAASGKGVT
jgi:hypothetical protein